jgi:hypothetical protein
MQPSHPDPRSQTIKSCRTCGSEETAKLVGRVHKAQTPFCLTSASRRLAWPAPQQDVSLRRMASRYRVIYEIHFYQICRLICSGLFEVPGLSVFVLVVHSWTECKFLAAHTSQIHLAGVDKDDVAPKTIAEVVEPILSNTPILIETFKKAIGYSSVLGMWQANVHDSL